MMHTIAKPAGQIIAADTQATVAAIDAAVLTCSRLCGSIIEVSTSSKLPVATAQKALASAANAMVATVQGRDEIAAATRELLKVQRMSNLETTAFGCPDGFPPKTARVDDQEPTTA
jgi:hypothetical protein